MAGVHIAVLIKIMSNLEMLSSFALICTMNNKTHATTFKIACEFVK